MWTSNLVLRIVHERFPLGNPCGGYHCIHDHVLAEIK